MSKACISFRWGISGCLAALLALLLAPLGFADQPEIACGSPAEGGGGHAWLIRAEERGPVLIWHLPPRISGSTPGRTRIAGEAGAMPTAAIAVGARLYLIFDDKPDVPPAKPRQVLSMSAAPMGDWGRWTTRPSGRFETAPSLRSDGRILASVGSANAPWVLLHGLRETPARLVLLRLGADGWEPVELPEAAQTLAANATHITGNQISTALVWKLVAAPRGVGLIAFDPAGNPLPGGADASGSGAIAAWMAESSKEEAVRWSPLPLALPEQVSLVSLAVCVTGGRLVVAVPEPSNTLSLFARALGAERPELRPLATLRAVDTPFSLCALDADGDAAVFYGEPAGAGGDAQQRSVRMVGEVSARTGRIMYQGRLIGIAPVAPSDYRLMTLLMFLVVGSVVLFVARPPGDPPAVHVPRDCALAGPAQRGVAAGIDMAIGVTLAATLWRVPLASLTTPEWWGGAESWSVCLTALVLLICGCTLCEAFIGKTVGKVLSGCEVVSTRDENGESDGRRPSFASALLRNLLKWVVPIIALVGVLDVTRRHRADEWAGTAVIVRASEEPEEP